MADTVLELMQEAVARYDRKPFLLIRPGFRTRITRYRDLGRIVPRVARVLHDRGLRKGDRAIMWAVNRPEWGITLLGAIHAGVVLVPLDVRSAPDFAAKVAAKTRASLVFASQQTAAQAAALGLPVVLIERIPDLARTAEPLPAADIGPDDLVEVLFTSGTTGEPKGAMLTHRNLASNAQELPKVFPIGPKERMLSVLPLSHIFEQSPGFLVPMHAGASVVYPVSRQPSVLLRTFRDFKVSILLIVPQGLKLLDNAIERKVDQGGKRATFEKLHRWAENAPRFMRRLLFRPVLSSFGGRLHTVGIGGSALDPVLGQPLGGDGDQRPPGLRRHRAGSAGQLHPQGRTTGWGRWARRLAGWRCGSPRTARSWSAARACSPATGRTPSGRRRCSSPMAGTTPATSARSAPMGS